MKVLLGVSASIAAHRALDLASSLRKQGHEVSAVLSANAPRIITPAALEAICGRRAVVSLWDEDHTGNMDHLALTKWADIFVVLPATADVLASLALGTASDALNTMALAWPQHRPLFVCPAMNPAMWFHPATQLHAETLRQRGVRLLGPVHGETACRDEGVGRLIAVEEVLEAILQISPDSGTPSELAGETVLITGGPTAEAMDPVRHMTNPSTGRMALALATEARRLGARVQLILGPTHLPVGHLHGVELTRVVSAQDMQQAVMDRLAGATTVIFAAAVSDWMPRNPSSAKLRKESLPPDHVLTVEFVRTPDIALSAHGQRLPHQIFVGFSAESHLPVETALEKARRKGFDLIFANPIDQADAGFAVETNHGWLIEPGREGSAENPPKIEAVPVQSKHSVAHLILERIPQLRRTRHGE